jgi:hypothetical protein
VSIVPVIAKSDCLTMKEIARLKQRVLEEIAENGIRIYNLPDCDTDEDEEYKLQVSPSLSHRNRNLYRRHCWGSGTGPPGSGTGSISQRCGFGFGSFPFLIKETVGLGFDPDPR